MHRQISLFSKYRNHPLFEQVFKMYQVGFGNDALPGNLHCFQENGELKEGIRNISPYTERAGGKENLFRFLRLLSDYRNEINYGQFIQGKVDFYHEQGQRILEHT